MQSQTTVRKRFYDLLYVWNLVPTVAIFKLIYSKKLDLSAYFNSYRDIFNWHAIYIFLTDKGFMLIIASIFIYLYYAVTVEQRFDVKAASDVFSPEKTPSDWQKFLGKDILIFVIITNIVQFILLGLFVDNILPFSGILFTFFLLSVIGNYKTKAIINDYFANPVYFPNASYKLTRFVKRRRKVISKFVNRRHSEKDFFVALGCLLVFILAYRDTQDSIVPYLLLALIITTNEFIVWRWRSKRNKAIDEINVDQDAYLINMEDSKNPPARRTNTTQN
jgi:hypothetical protein